jgi:hypothetical protein
MPSLPLAVNDEAIEETAATPAFGPWEQHIISHLISHCNSRGLEPIEEIPSSDFEENANSSVGYDSNDEDEMIPVTKSKKQTQGKQKGKPAAGTVLYQCRNGDSWLTPVQWVRASVLRIVRKKPLVILKVSFRRLWVLIRG